MPETASAASATSNPRVMLRAALPPQNFSLQLLFTSFFLLIFRLRRAADPPGVDADSCGIAPLPLESRLAAARPPAHLQDRRFHSRQSLAARKEFRRKFQVSSKDNHVRRNKGPIRVREIPLRPPGTPPPLRWPTGFSVAEVV